MLCSTTVVVEYQPYSDRQEMLTRPVPKTVEKQLLLVVRERESAGTTVFDGFESILAVGTPPETEEPITRVGPL